MAAVNTAQMVELLSHLTSPNKEVREPATVIFDKAKMSEADNLVIGFMSVLASTGNVEEKLRTAAAVFLRQMVNRRAGEKTFVWPRMQPQNQQEVAAELLRRFEAEKSAPVQKKIGGVISQLALFVCDDGDPRGWLVQGGNIGWPALLPTVFKIANPATNSDIATCLEGMRLLKELVLSTGSEMVGAQQELSTLIQSALTHADLKIRHYALLLICEMVQRLKKKEWAPLVKTAPVLTQILKDLATANPIMEDELNDAIQEMISVASMEPDFFKAQLSSSLEPLNFIASLVKSKEGLEAQTRQVALEWLVSYLEKKPKWISKSLQEYPKVVVECCMALMLEVDDGEAELKAWVTLMDDEQGEEDVDELFHCGEQAIDRVTQVLGMEAISSAMFALIGQLVAQNSWQAKHAALAVIKQTVEYVENTDHMNEMAKLLLQHVNHEHPRVRYTALHALGQLANDQAPQFQEAWHRTVMPTLLTKMDDGVDRVAAMAMSAFVAFGEQLDNALMIAYANSFMEKLVARMNTTQHRGVREESITAIAVIAGVMEKDFAAYYDLTMPMLKEIVIKATGEKESRLRGKSFECMSLLGVAVGKEKFLPDAKEAVGAMLNTSLEANDIQREYIKEASERICHCLKEDFAPFLNVLLPGILKSLKFDGSDADDSAVDDDDEETAVFQTEDGKYVKVKSSQFEELMASISLLWTFADEMKGAYFDYVQSTAEALVPLISSKNEVIQLISDEVYATALQTWSCLIKCANLGAKQRNLQSEMAKQMLQKFIQTVVTEMESQDDAETLGAAASGVAECLKGVGEGCLSGEEALQLVGRFFQLIDDSLKRCEKHEKKDKNAYDGAPAELAKDEDDEQAKSDGLEDELTCLRCYAEVLGAVMKVAPDDFMRCLPDCGNKMQVWLASQRTRVLALHLSCDLLEHLKERTVSIWPAFMKSLFDALGDDDANVRIAAAYAVNLASSIPQFSEAAPEAFKRLAVILSRPAPKKKDETGRLALDNAVAALLALARHVGAQCPADVPAWTLVVSKLPMRHDWEEAKKVHNIIADLVLAQNAGLLGTDGANLGNVLSALAEVYQQEYICEQQTDEKIKRIFQNIPQPTLLALAQKFTEKQQKRIEKMLSKVAQHGG